VEIQDAPYRLEISNQLIVRPPGNGQLLWVGWHFSASLSSLASYSWPRSGILRTKDDPAMKISNPATQTDAFLSGSKKGDRVWPVSVALGMDEDVPRYEMPGAEQDRERTESQRIFKDLEKTIAEALFSDGRGQLTGYFPASSHPRLIPANYHPVLNSYRSLHVAWPIDTHVLCFPVYIESNPRLIALLALRSDGNPEGLVFYLFPFPRLSRMPWLALRNEGRNEGSSRGSLAEHCENMRSEHGLPFAFDLQLATVNSLNPLESALPQNSRVTHLESALPKTIHLKGDYSLDTITHFW